MTMIPEMNTNGLSEVYIYTLQQCLKASKLYLSSKGTLQEVRGKEKQTSKSKTTKHQKSYKAAVDVLKTQAYRQIGQNVSWDGNIYFLLLYSTYKINSFNFKVWFLLLVGIDTL